VHVQLLATQEGGTFFFDEDSDFVTGYSSSLRSEFVFGLPASGTDGSWGAAREIYEDLCKGMTIFSFFLETVGLPCHVALSEVTWCSVQKIPLVRELSLPTEHEPRLSCIVGHSTLEPVIVLLCVCIRWTSLLLTEPNWKLDV
jgi:hypothetical protein